MRRPFIARLLNPAALALALIAPASVAQALDRLDFRLTGNAARGETAEDLLADIRSGSLLALAQSDGRVSAQDLFAAAQSDYRRIIEILYAQGRYAPVVNIRLDGREAALIAPLSPPTSVGTITVTVDPGPAFNFGTARVAPLAPGTVLPESFRTGKLARSTLIRDAALAGVQGWRAAGHAKADVAAQDLTARHDQSRLDADITLAPGPKLRFGQLKVVRDGTTVGPSRIRAIAALPEGETFDPEALERSANRLRRTGAFRSVVLQEAGTPGPGQTLDITATVVDEKPRRIGAGAELSSFEGVTLEGFWLHRNITNRADRLRVEGKISGIGGNSGGIDYRLAARFERPAVYGPDTKGFAFAELEHLDEPDYTERLFNIGLGASRYFSETLTGELAIALRRSRIDDAFGRRDFTLLTFPGELEWDRRDDQLNPSSGHYIKADVTPFISLQGAGNGARMLLDARAYRAVSDNIVLAGRAQLGAIPGAGLAGTPPDYLFYSGGGGTVRGQPYRSLDVALPGGGRSGGRSFASLSAEIRAGLGDSKFSLVGFADAGYIGSGPFPDGSGDWHAGAGLGLRYDTTVGPIRLDVAGPIGGNTGDGVQVYIGIGQAF